MLNKGSGETTEQVAARWGPGFHLASRLDAATSGALPLAYGDMPARYLQAQFAGRLVRKDYICLCEGPSLGPRHTVGRISRKLLVGKRTEVCEDGLEAETIYLVKERYASEASELMLLKVRPLTGRQHQIRVHLSSLGRPIVGDQAYGGRGQLRLFLHCARLRLRDPQGRPITVESPLPRRLAKFLATLQNRSGTVMPGSQVHGVGRLRAAVPFNTLAAHLSAQRTVSGWSRQASHTLWIKSF